MENIEDIYELSPIQQGMLFHSLLNPKSDVYFVHQIFAIEGQLDTCAFEQAWQRILDRHPILRTAFVWEELERPVQVVFRHVALAMERYDWKDISSAEEQARLGAFIRQRGGVVLSEAPLLRLALIEIAARSYRFIFSCHHLLLDGWSTSLLLTQSLAFYEAFCQGRNLQMEPSRPYSDYIGWLQQQNLAEAELFWRNELKDLTACTRLSVDRIPDAKINREARYGEQRGRLSRDATQALHSVAIQHGLTLNTLIQGAWALLQSRYNDERDIIFGATVSGRPPGLNGVESIVGPFINTLPVRVHVTRQAKLVTWLKELQDRQAMARQYEHSPLVQIQEWSEVPWGLPLFEAILVFENYPGAQSLERQIGGLKIRGIGASNQTNYPLTVCVSLEASVLDLSLSYDMDRFDDATIIRMLGHLQVLLESFSANPDRSLAEVPLLTKGEQHQLRIEWNDTGRNYLLDACIHQLFEFQVTQMPDAVAMVDGDEHLTYRELNRRANQVAHHLRALGVGPEVLVGICMERSLEMVVGLLGILKAGGAYLPLDPAYPRERVAFMLDDARVPVLLSQQRLMGGLPTAETQVVCLDSGWEHIAQRDGTNPISGVTLENLAYVLYTSGSTGRPKGVAIEHRNTVTLLHWGRDILASEDIAAVLASTSLCFDCSVFELFVPLSWGGRIILAQDVLHLPELPAASTVTLVSTVPSAMTELLRIAGVPASTRIINLGGEPPQSALVRQLYQQTAVRQVLNVYGPAEDTTYSTFHRIARDASGLLPIGRPIAETFLYVLDSDDSTVPVGVPGELHIGGAGLSRGYLNRPDLTADKFVPNPFSDKPGARLYKTGDWVRYLPDGNLVFLGRMDHQVKVRGFRIELEEIEAVLRRHPAVQEAVVTIRQDHEHQKRLVAYVVPQPRQSLSVGDLQRLLQQALPGYMVPSAIVILEALPLMPNGKVDRQALPAPDENRCRKEDNFVAPRTPVEKTLAEIWANVLELEQVGIYDNFFELGGNSLLAIRIISRIREAFQVEAPIEMAFSKPTVAEAALTILEMQLQQEDAEEVAKMIKG